MARDYDGANDEIRFGSDASIDDIVAITVACFLRWDDTATYEVILTKAAAGAAGWRLLTDTADKAAFGREYSLAEGLWYGSTTLGGGIRHILASHNGVVTSDARIVVDGNVETVGETATPSGTLNADAASSMFSGEQSDGTLDLDGAIQCLTLWNSVIDSGAENRHRWWGMAPGGPSTMLVWHPFFTSKLTNTGTGVADGTAVGSGLMTSLARVIRPGTGMMGVMSA